MGDISARELLERLPDEILTVIGNHLPPGDLQRARLVNRRWRELLRSSGVHVVVRPHALAQPTEAPARAPSSGGGASSASRPRRSAASYIQPTPADRRQPPACLQPPPLRGLHSTFPGANRVSVRLLSRIGQRGLGITTRPDRLVELFDSLARLGNRPGALTAAPGDGAPGNGPGGGRSAAGPLQGAAAHGGAEPFLQLEAVLDIDVPRARHKEAHAAASEVARLLGQHLTRLGGTLKALRLQWYDARLAHLAGLPACLAGLPALQRLELPMTPGALLPALSSLARLTCLSVAAVGDVLHMQDLGVPRHTEIAHLSCLTALEELRLDGWACEVTLVKALVDLSALRALQLGDDLAGAAQSLPLTVLSRLTALTTPVSIHVMAAAAASASPTPDAATSPARPPPGAVRAGPCMALPRLQVLHGPPPMARLSSAQAPAPPIPPSSRAPDAADANAMGSRPALGGGESGRGVPAPEPAAPPPDGAAATQAGGDGGVGQGFGGLGLERMAAGARAQGFSGAARRRALAPTIWTPWLRSLTVELNPVPAAHAAAELGVGEVLSRLTRLHARVVAVAEDDLAVVQPVLEAAARGAFPRLKELQVQLTRAGLVSPAAMLAALPECGAVLGGLTSLTSLQLTGLWDGLVPEGWDYSTKAALGGMPGQRFVPSGLSPLKHLRFLRALPSLTTLVLHTDRCRLALLPPTLTSLTLEGLVHIDAPTPPSPQPPPLHGATPTAAAPQGGAASGRAASNGHLDAPTPPAPRRSGGGGGGGGSGRKQPPSWRPAGEREPAWAHASTWEEHQAQLVCPRLKKLSVMLAKHPRTVQPGGGGAGGTPAGGASKVPVRGAYCVLDDLRPLLAPSLTSLSFTATPSPAHTRLEHLTPASYGVDRLAARLLAPPPPPRPPITAAGAGTAPSAAAAVDEAGVGGAAECAADARAGAMEVDGEGARGRTPGVPDSAPLLPALQTLQLYVMPRHAWLLDCRQLAPLSALGALRCLNLESPLTGATRLACLTALSALTQLAAVVTGRLDDEAYDGRVCVSGCSPAQRSQALSWLSGLVAGRFGALPVPAATPSFAPGGPSGGGGGGSAAQTPAPAGARGRSTCSPSPPPPPTAPAAGGAGGAEAAGGEEEIGALVGSDVEVHSEDLLFDSQEGEDVWTEDDDVALYSEDEGEEEEEEDL